ncbi:MAG: FG-GAP-like repeat-containing protein [Bacteroidetes bacterium]|nr:FG-GAP-like repeat-containing protein [Bacteroidota bacterium]MDA1335873.1 FG-GAP-like repeat-containing protein [Bacteroidota bacterium]
MRNITLFLALITGITVQAQSFSNASSSLPDAYHSGNCVGFTDMDNDGYDDIVVLDDSKIVKVLYQDATGAFTEVDYGNVSNNNQWGMTIGDYDNDGHKDVFSGGAYDGVHIKHINAVGDFVSFDLDNGSMFMQACNFADIDNDGQLDAFGCHDDALSRMWKGNGEALDFDAGLIDLTNYDYSEYPNTDHSGNYGTVFSDFDNDGDIDLTIAKCRQFVNDPFDPRRVNQIWLNNGDGTWSEVAEERGLVLNEQSWTVDYADVDNDGDWDCFLTNHSTTMKLLENDGNGYFTDITDAAGLNFSGFALQAKLADFDNDGFVDVLVSGGVHRYYRNNGDGTFTQDNAFTAGDTMHSFAIGDVNRDGAIDVYASYGNGYNSPDGNNADILWLNNGNDNHWIAFDLEGIESNKDAVGAKVILTGAFGTMIREVRAGESYGITNTFACMFGLGTHDAVEVATIKWPSGLEIVIDNPAIDQYHNLLEAPCVADIELSYPTELTLCPGETLTISAVGDFVEYNWSNGATESSIEVGEAGVYGLTAYDANGCAAVSEMITVVVTEAEAPEITVVGELSFCDGGSVEFIGPNGDEWTWSNGETTQSISVTESGTYSLVLIDACGNENPSEEFVVEVLTAPATPDITYPSEVSAGELVTFTSSSETTHWYDSEAAAEPLAVGLSYEMTINETTTLWVEDVQTSGLVEATGGRTEMGQGQYHDNSVRWLLFDVYEDVIIHSVDVFANGAGLREIGVIDSEGNVLVSGEFDVQDGQNTVILDFEVPAGTGYGLRSFDNDPQLWRDGTGTEMAYPYELGSLGAITQSTAGGNNATNYYYFFYNWVVQTPSVGCASERIPVMVNILGLDENGKAPFTVFPNPSNGWVHVQFDGIGGNAAWTLTNAMGQVVNKGFIQPGLNRLDWTGHAKGYYVMQVLDGDEQQAIQIMID